LVPDLFFVEETCREESCATILIGLFDLADILLECFLLISDPVFEGAELIPEDGGCCLFNFAGHAFLPFVGLSALVAALDGGLEVGNFGVEGDELVESVLEAVGEDIPVAGMFLLLFFLGLNMRFFLLLFFVNLFALPGHILKKSNYYKPNHI